MIFADRVLFGFFVFPKFVNVFYFFVFQTPEANRPRPLSGPNRPGWICRFVLATGAPADVFFTHFCKRFLFGVSHPSTPTHTR